MTEMVVTRERLDRIGGRVDCPIREDGNEVFTEKGFERDHRPLLRPAPRARGVWGCAPLGQAAGPATSVADPSLGRGQGWGSRKAVACHR